MKTYYYYILIGIVLVLFAFPVSATVVHPGRRITVVQPLDACSSVQEQNGSISTGSARALITDTYFDALGHKTLSVLHKGSSLTKDFVVDYDCNVSGQIVRVSNPLPVLRSTTLQEGSIPLAIMNYYDDAVPYTSSTYETTSKHRVLSETQQGESYQSHPSTYTYRANAANEVARWTITESGIQRSGFYMEETLSATTKTDAEGSAVTVFTNMLGQTIMRKQGSGETYYVYDSFGLLRYILPPAVSERLGDGIYVDSNETLSLYAYSYRYDRKGQLITKRLPGCDTISYEYNSLGQLVYTQDGNQRQRGDFWLKIEYDNQGRKTVISEVNRSDGTYCKLLQEFYYDNYTQVPASGGFGFIVKTGYANACSSAVGLLTMTKTYELTMNNMETEVYYYDYLGRCIQKHKSSGMGIHSYFYAYNHDGTVIRSEHSIFDYTETYAHSYDHLGRKTTTQYRLKYEKEFEGNVTQCICMYNEIGQQYHKTFHNGNLVRVDSFDIRGNLTKRTENGFTERLYYADNLPSGATPHYNGLISASSVTQDYENVSFTYQYDNQNRLTYAQGNNKCHEQFEYDEMGNIWYMTRKNEDGYLDVLFCDHHGNQLIEAFDAAGNQNYYNTKEYRDVTNADTTMYYDKNGTIIVDLDRNICAIRNNILNLPDTVQFVNGNQIINHYDAMGRKKSTTYRTLITPTVVPVGAVVNLPSNSYTTRTTYYYDNFEIGVMPTGGTYFRFYTPEGYSQTDDLAGNVQHNYYVHDHLGNVCAVWSSIANDFVQKTFYYPSGLPINNSSGQSVQPNKYNGKPYEEMHGLDIYEYEARGYYATIMRFTAMDPLCEQTPWQSPYVYAANNPVCNVDWMGLYPSGFSSGSYGTYHMTIIDSNGNVLYHIDNGNTGVYLFDDDNFDENNIDYSALLLIGFELPYVRYKVNSPCLYLRMFMEGGNAYADPISYSVIYYGNRPATASEISNWLSDIPKSSLESVLEYAMGFTSDYLPGPYNKIIKNVGYVLSIIAIGSDICKIYMSKDIIDSSENIVVEALSFTSGFLAYSPLLLAALTIDIYYKGGKKIAETVSDINTTWNNSEYVYDWFGWNYMMY